MKHGTYLRSPSTSGRSFVMAMTSANNVTNAVMKATGELQGKIDVSKIENMLKYHIQVPIPNNKNR